MATHLVTGGAGFIGSHIVEALLQRGDRVRVLDNLVTGHKSNLAGLAGDVEFLEGDLNDAGLVARAVKGAEVVFHHAALASVPWSVERPLESHAAGATGTVNLLDQCRHANVKRVVYAASSSVYGDRPFASKRETDPPDPLSPYAAAKAAGELYCQAFAHTYGLETVCLRYFNVFGPRQDPNSPYSAVIPIFITRLLAGQRPVVYGDGRQTRDFTFVGNVVHANLLAAAAKNVAGQVINAANGIATSLLDLIAALNRQLGTNVQPEFAPARVGDVRESLADITLARQLLDYEPKFHFEEGLQLSIDYYRRLVQAKAAKAGAP